MKHIWYMVLIGLMLLSAGGAGVSAQAAEATGKGERSAVVVGYYAGWSAGKGYTPWDVPANRLTHLNYAFGGIDKEQGTLIMTNPDTDRKNFEQLRAVKKENPGLRTLISVGGWDESTYFSVVASTEAKRETFAQSCLDFILTHGFDGIDLDWEYPVSGGPAGIINSPQDRENFTLLLAAIRNKLDARGRIDGKKYDLTIAGAANSNYLQKIEGRKVAALVDHIFVMAYDMHGMWDTYSDLGAPLYQPSGYSPQYKNSVADGIQAYLSAGIPAEKLVLGIPFYGYLYEGVSGEGQGLYSPFRSARSIAYDEVVGSYITKAGMNQAFHAEAVVPYLYGNGLFVSYDDARSVRAKAFYAGSQGLAGVGIWELSHNRNGELARHAYEGLLEGRGGKMP